MSRYLLFVLILAITALSMSCEKEKDALETKESLEMEWYEEHSTNYFETVDFSDFDV